MLLCTSLACVGFRRMQLKWQHNMKMSKKHELEMIDKKDDAHSKAMREMQELMHFPQGMNAWYENKRKAFECLPASNN